MIKIEKTGSLYNVHATPPHVREEWVTPDPIDRRAVIGELISRGAHQTDVGDALYEAHPNWLSSRVPKGEAILSRTCSVTDENGIVAPLTIKFYPPEESQEYGDHIGFVDINCEFFSRTLRSVGEDAAQAFFLLPGVVVAYLIGQRRFGYETYWLEPGDLDCADFWTYKQ